jgi:hypothetical protein
LSPPWLKFCYIESLFPFVFSPKFLFADNSTSRVRDIALTFRAAPLRVRVISKPTNISENMETKFNCRIVFIFVAVA